MGTPFTSAMDCMHARALAARPHKSTSQQAGCKTPKCTDLQRVVLVGGRGDLHLAAVRDNQPGPAAAKAPSSGSIELGLELVQGAECCICGGLQIGAGAVVVARLAHDFPEKGVVVVPAAIVAACRASTAQKHTLVLALGVSRWHDCRPMPKQPSE